MDSDSNNEIQKICDELKKHYIILNKKYNILDCPNGILKQTISKDGKDIGGIDITPNEEGIVVINGIAFAKQERNKGNGRKVLAMIFCDTKVEKILAASVDKSIEFYRKMGADINSQKNYDVEIIREKFFQILRLKPSPLFL
jgi:hypothetical protein